MGQALFSCLEPPSDMDGKEQNEQCQRELGTSVKNFGKVFPEDVNSNNNSNNVPKEGYKPQSGDNVNSEAIALSELIQKVTPQECQRFLNLRTMEKAEEKLRNYKEFRQRYRLDEDRGSRDDMNNNSNMDRKERDDAIWEQAIRMALWSFPHFAEQTQHSTSSSSLDSSSKSMHTKGNKNSKMTKTTTSSGNSSSSDGNGNGNVAGLIKLLPRFIQMHDNATSTGTVGTDGGGSGSGSGTVTGTDTDTNDKRGDKRVLHIFMNLVDARIAPLKFYALVVAIYLDLHLDRNSMESIVALLDVRKGKGWCNPPPLSLLPFLKDTIKHMEYYPERMYRCIVHPVPYPAKPIWYVAKGVLKETMVKRVRIHWGSSSVSSPAPKTLGDFFDKDDLEFFENVRLSEFR